MRYLVAALSSFLILIASPARTFAAGPGLQLPLVLVNASTGAQVPFTNGINIDSSKGSLWFIKAEANSRASSVKFRLDSDASSFDNDRPFTSHPGSPKTGKHALKITPYSRNNADGNAGPTITINFTIGSEPTPTPTPEPTIEPTPIPTPSSTPSPSPSPSSTPSPSATPTASPTPMPTPDPSPTATPTGTPSPIATPTPSPSPTPTASPTASPTVTPTPSPSATPAHIIDAISLSAGDVQSAINQAVDGDLVLLPAGSATWTVQVNINHAITIQGAGVGNSIITNAITTANAQACFAFNTTNAYDAASLAAGKPSYRITGIEFRSVNTRNVLRGIVNLNGTSHRIRADHIFFNNIDDQESIRISDWALGVLDHVDFTGRAQKVSINHPAWGGGTNGDGSWSAANTFGTADALFIEDFTATSTGASRGLVDGEFGGRVVARHGLLNNTTLNCHGTQGNQLDRSMRQMEFYDVTFVNVHDNHVIDSRGGAAVVFNCNADGGTAIMHLNDYRANNLPGGRWGAASGFNPLDDNYPGGPFETGAHTGATGAISLTDTSKNWTPANKWRGYSIYNVATGRQAVILSSTATTLTYGSPTVGATTMTWTNGDAYRIWQVRSALDMPGMGKDNGLNRTTMVWPNQIIEGVYGWNNKINGNPALIAADGYPYIQEGIHFFNTQKPGYTPFIYPHPLTAN